MHVHFEKCPHAKCDCTILALTWMGRVPEEISDDSAFDGWKLNRSDYYQDGWLATANVRGIVGVTFTSIHSVSEEKLNSNGEQAFESDSEPPPKRTNYNLRGHRSEVTLVKWNDPYQKLASCDSSGIIFVWIKYEGRWSIELINDRNTQVTDFSWSHDGRMALICYQDGFVLVGSVAGQRYWSSMLNLESTTITCGIWSPDDQQVLFGTADGQIIVMDVHGSMVGQVSLQDDVAINQMCWGCPKFKMDESDLMYDKERKDSLSDSELSSRTQNGFTPFSNRRPSHFIDDNGIPMAVCFKNGVVSIVRSYDDISPITILTNLRGVKLEWSNNGQILAVAGVSPDSRLGEYSNWLKFYTVKGTIRYQVQIPYSQHAVSALCWGHNDKRLFVATGPQLNIAWVTVKKMASLQLLSQLSIRNELVSDEMVSKLQLPTRLKLLTTALFAQTLQCTYPNNQEMRKLVTEPQKNNVRLHCTMIRHADDLYYSGSNPNYSTTNGTAYGSGNVALTGACYTLYLEYLGGLVPMIKGRRMSRLRPEFVIFDPQIPDEPYGVRAGSYQEQSELYMAFKEKNRYPNSEEMSDSDDKIDATASPRMRRKRQKQKQKRKQMLRDHQNFVSSSVGGVYSDGTAHSESESDIGGEMGDYKPYQSRLVDELAYIDSLPENKRLAEVTSNIWGTKFKMHSVSPCLPSVLGSVTYKTSLLHLQPRQMTITITELGDDWTNMYLASSANRNEPPDVGPTVFNSDTFSEDDDDALSGIFERDVSPAPIRKKDAIPIAPMTPKRGSRHFELRPLENINHTRPTQLRTISNHLPSEIVHSTPYDDKNSDTNDWVRSGHDSTSRSSDFDDNVYSNSFVADRSSISIVSHRNGLVSVGIGSQSGSDYVDFLHHTGAIPKVKAAMYEQSSMMRRVHGSPTKGCGSKKGEKKSGSPKKDGKGCSPQKRGSKSSPRKVGLIDSSKGRWTEKAVQVKLKDSDLFGDLCEGRRSGCSISSQAQQCLNSTKSFKQRSSSSQMYVANRSRSYENLNLAFVRSRHEYSISSFHEKRIDWSCVSTQAELQRPKRSKLSFCENSENHPPEYMPLKQEGALTYFAKCNTGGSILMRNAQSQTQDERQQPPKNYSNPKNHLKKKPEIVRSTPPTPPTPKKQRKVSADVTTEKSMSPIRWALLKSPLLPRRHQRKLQKTSGDSSDEDGGVGFKCGIQIDKQAGNLAANYKDLESFQKTSIKQKLKTCRQRSSSAGATVDSHSSKASKMLSRQSGASNCLDTFAGRKEFVMHNKAPLWNENSQVYQLDFGGRVTQESAKNFQIEFRGKQVMQFGRIDGNAYTLDFQYPFTAVQAFAVALANVTQRFK